MNKKSNFICCINSNIAKIIFVSAISFLFVGCSSYSININKSKEQHKQKTEINSDQYESANYIKNMDDIFGSENYLL